jgi:hypothetical protein
MLSYVGNLGSFGGVPELADGLDLGSSAAMRGGSSPPFPTLLDSNQYLGDNSESGGKSSTY